jgi:hypothetical protein
MAAEALRAAVVHGHQAIPHDEHVGHGEHDGHAEGQHGQHGQGDAHAGHDEAMFARPLAAGAPAGLGVVMPAWIGGLLMSASTIVVAINAQTLRGLRL